MGYVYSLNNTVNGKGYIGATKNKPEIRWGHGCNYKGELREDIKKYGWDNFNKYYIEVPDEELEDFESFCIALFGTAKDGYNKAKRGSTWGVVKTEETRQKLSDALKGRHLTEETKQKMSDSKKGIPFSPELKDRMKEYHYKRTVLQYSKDGKLIKEYSSIMDAERETGILHISRCCQGKYKTSGGYIWKYA